MTLSGLLCAALVLAACSGGGSGAGDVSGAESSRPSSPGPSSTGPPSTQAPTTVDGIRYPGTQWPTATPAQEGLDPAGLDAAARTAKAHDSTCFLVARHGRVVGEWYWGDGAAEKPREVFSVTKSITSTLVGIAQADGDLALDDPAADWIPEWRGGDSAGVTVRNLVSNDSGRFWSFASDYSVMTREPDRTAYAVGLDQQDPPGSTWVYNNAAIQTLDEVLSTATGERTSDFADQRLFSPLGMAHTTMTPTGDDGTNTYFGMQTTCGDLARVGHLFLHQGRWRGEQVVPQAWVAQAVGRSSQQLNQGYGYLWWLNRRGRLLSSVQATTPRGEPEQATVGQLAPGAPQDMYAALGLGGQVLMVDPGSETVVVRIGELGGSGGSYSLTDAAKVLDAETR